MATYEELRRHIDAAYALLPEFQECSRGPPT